MYRDDVELEPVPPTNSRRSFNSLRVHVPGVNVMAVGGLVVVANVLLLPFAVVPLQSWHLVFVTRVVFDTLALAFAVTLTIVALAGTPDVSNR